MLGLVHEARSWELGAHLVGHAAPLLASSRVSCANTGTDGRGDHAPLGFAACARAFHEVHRQRCQVALSTLDHLPLMPSWLSLMTSLTRAGPTVEASQELRPEQFGLTGGDLQAQHLALAHSVLTPTATITPRSQCARPRVS